jgi:hypothetical protein
MSFDREEHLDPACPWETAGDEGSIFPIASPKADSEKKVSEVASEDISSVDLEEKNAKDHELTQRDQRARQVQTGSPVPGVQFKLGGRQAPLRAVRDDGARCGISGLPRCSMQ